MILFDDALPRLVEACEQTDAAWGGRVRRFAVLRDHQGKLHLLLCGKPGHPLELAPVQALEQALQQDLGGYFVPPLLFDEDPDDDRRRLARHLDQRCAQLFKPWDPDPPASPGRWFKLERRLSKLDWLDSPIAPPWVARAQAPFIASFYSFKGGVGRTTALLSCAYQLAQQGTPVAVVDLDLEAPGLGSALTTEPPRRGVLDFLVEYLVHERADALDDYVTRASALGDELAPLVAVYPAGDLQRSFLEKLGRLDFLGKPDDGVRRSPVGEALEALLTAMRRQPPSGFPVPEVILLDSRAGLHDLAGLALHGLSHLDVLCARATRQSIDGLDLTLCTLGQRKQGLRELPRCVVVHTMAADSDAALAHESSYFLDRSYAAFLQHIYEPLQRRGDLPQLPPRDGSKAYPHEPEVLPYNNQLARFDTLTPTVLGQLAQPPYQQLLQRILQARPRS